MLFFFLLILAVSQRRFFSVAILAIYSVLLYNMSFLEVPDVSCIWSVVTIYLCSLSQYIFLASWTLARARGKKLCLLDPYTFFYTGCDKVGGYVNFATSRQRVIDVPRGKKHS